MTDAELPDRLYRSELALARRDATGLGVQADPLALLDDDFLEVGQSGRVWTRASIASLLAAGPAPGAAALDLESFEVTRLAETVALVTYRVAGVRRASIWVHRDGRWRLRYHQGTPATADDAPAHGAG